MDVSVIIPIFNEEGNLPVLHQQLCSALDNFNKDYEILYVNDGSTDGSLGVLKELQSGHKKIRIISFDRNYGKTSALDAGLRNVKGKHILTIDADLQGDVNDLMRVYEGLGDYDIVIGRRINRLQVDGFIKFASSRIANFIRNRVLRESYSDAGCFLCGYKRECLKDLVFYRGFQVFMVSLADMHGYRIKEIDIKVYPRRHGESKYNIRNRLFKELMALFVVRWLKSNRLNYRISYLD